MLSAPVFDLQRFSVHDGPGVRTTVFLAGCSLRCAWCHNPESFAGAGARRLTTGEVLAEVLRDRAFYQSSGGGVTVSGGEPLLHPGFVRELLGQAKQEGLHTCVQTAGAVSEAACLEVLEVVDLFQLDLKHLDPERHRALTGEDNRRVHATAELLLSRGAKVEFRVPVVPGLNDAAANLEATARFLVGRGVPALTLLPYQPLGLAKYAELGVSARCAEVTPPSAQAMQALAQRLGALGVAATVGA